MKIKSFFGAFVDYFLILSAIIGVGFASGKEISVFFFDFGQASILGLIAFALLYLYLFFVIDYVKHKIMANSYNEFNTTLFGKFVKISNVFMVVNFAITSAGMLAGADYLFETFFNVKYHIPSLTLSLIIFFLLIGGMGKIKFVSNLIIPIMIFAIVVNSIKNINPQNVNLPVVSQSGTMALWYGLLFGINNFVAALPIIFETKLKSKGKIFVIFSICLIILLNILVLASSNFSTDMPMFELSANVSSWFYYLYFATLILALFSTLMICCYNMHLILFNGKKSKFCASTILLINLIVSQLGYAFIVKYLYVLSGIISAIYILILIILVIVKLVKLKLRKEKTSLEIN